MSQPVESPVEALLGRLDLEAVGAWLEEQRWYASKSRHVAGLEVEEAVALTDDPPLVLALVQARFATGSHDLYQLPLAFLSPGQGQTGSPVARTKQWTAVDAVADPELVRELLRHIESETAIDTGEGCVRFTKPERSGPLNPEAPARPMGVEQSNSSIVFGDETVLKVFRRLEPGINPELEMLRFLTRQEFPHIAPLQGLVRVREPLVLGHAGSGPALLPRRCRRLGARAPADPHRPGRVPDRARRPRNGDCRNAQHARLRRQRPGVQPRGAERRGAGAADGHDRRGHRAGVHPAPRRRAGGRDRRPRPGRARADRHAAPSWVSAAARSAPTATTTWARPCTYPADVGG